MALATLSIDLEAKLAKMEQGFDRASRVSEKFAAEQERRFQAIKGAAAGIGAAIAGAFSVAQIAQFARATIDGLDALNDLKDATGASIENISALEDVAARTGTSFESMSSTLIKFNRVLGDSKPGSETANILKQIGLSAEELKRLDPAEALRQTAVALSKFADDGNKARVIQELFGKSVAEAAPFLKDLSEQGQLNAKVTTEQAEAAEKFNKQLSALSKTGADLGRSVINPLVESLNKLAENFKEAEGGGEKFLLLLKKLSNLAPAQIIQDGLGRGLGAGIQERDVALIERQIAALEKRVAGNPNDAASQRRLENLRAQLIDANRMASLAGLSSGFDKTAASWGSGLPTVGDIPDKDSKAKKTLSELDKYIEKIERAREVALGLSAEEQAYLDIYLGRLGKVNDEQEKRIIGAVRETEEVKKRAEEEKRLQAILESTPTGKLEALRKTQVALAEAFQKGRFGLVGSEEALRRYTEAVSVTLPEATKQYLEEMEKVDAKTQELAANIDALLGNGLENVLSGNFKNILRDWERMLSQMAIRAAQAQLSKYLLGSDYGSTGYVGGALGNLFGTGGTYPTGGMYEGGYITPSAGPQAARGGRQSVAPVINIGQVGSNVSRAEMFDAITKAVATSEGRQMQRMRAAGVA